MTDERYTAEAYEQREGESVEQWSERLKKLHTAPTWHELRKRSEHADKAYEFLASAPFHGDAEMAKVMVDAARVHAELAIQDKLEELAQTIKFCTGQLLESNATLNENVKTAAQHLHADAKDLKAHLHLVHEEAA